jgi:Zn-finger nucleic acid-binding protein
MAGGAGNEKRFVGRHGRTARIPSTRRRRGPTSPRVNCPKCRGPELHPTLVHEIQVDRCTHCAGVWLDADELGRLLAHDAAELRPLTRGGAPGAADALAARCPRDGGALLRVASARERTVILDMCPACRGLWLDGGEFARLAAAAPKKEQG